MQLSPTANLNHKRRKYAAIKQMIGEIKRGETTSSQPIGYWLNEAKQAKRELDSEAKRIQALMMKGWK